METTELKERNKEALGDLQEIRKASRNPELVEQWGLDPRNQRDLKAFARLGMDAQKLRIQAAGRKLSPTENNLAALPTIGQQFLEAGGAGFVSIEKEAAKDLEVLLKRAPIGRWMLAQKGLSGWLAGLILGELPDIYDAGRCNECGIHLYRQADMTYIHPVPPAKRDGSASTNKCVHDGKLMIEGTYWIHERKPSTFVSFAGLATEPAWHCPECRYRLTWSINGKWVHDKYTKQPKGNCKYCGETFIFKGKPYPLDEHNPPLTPDTKVPAISLNASMRNYKGHTRKFNSLLRAKLIGPKGLGDQFVIQKTPKYREIYEGVKHRLKTTQSYKMDGWIESMAKRAAVSRFLIDLFIAWRGFEGLPCRPPYEEEKLGIVHHR